MKTKKNYWQIEVTASDTWNTDGTKIIERDCGHRHSTESGAERCLAYLTRRLSDGSLSLTWHRAALAEYER